MKNNDKNYFSRCKRNYDSVNISISKDNYYDAIIDEGDNFMGEYIGYVNGKIDTHGFGYKRKWVGKLIHGGSLKYEKYFSFLEFGADGDVGAEISEEQFNQEYRKCLALHRLGEEVPEAFLCLFRFLKDYEEPELFS